MEDLKLIEQICSNMRDVFSRVLDMSKKASTAGTCLYAPILLQQSLDQFGRCESGVRGGNGYLENELMSLIFIGKILLR
ncbi:hypothetical protein J2785_005422 [Burkholderia ambifaria]|nr:hypothetical protein [Burkholderia ambifaria]MDR6502242.1 hypothetical protein [Burkholderia ambifaria]